MKDGFISRIGIYGKRHYEHLKRTYVTSINVMRMNGTLEEYIKRVNSNAEEMFTKLVKQLAEKDGITETLKAEHQMLWVQRMNAIQQTAIEIVNNNLIFTP